MFAGKVTDPVDSEDSGVTVGTGPVTVEVTSEPERSEGVVGRSGWESGSVSRLKPADDTIYGGFVRSPVGGSPQVKALSHRQRPAKPVKAEPKRVRRTKLAIMGIPADVIDQGDPRYARCIRLAAGYRKARVQELFNAHGMVSSGASGLLATASLALSASRYLYELAATADMTKLPVLLKTAQSMADSARQNELAAWELCAREATARKRAGIMTDATPWLQQAQLPVRDKPKRGRPRKQDVVQSEVAGLPPVGSPLDGWLQAVEEDNAGTPMEIVGS